MIYNEYIQYQSITENIKKKKSPAFMKLKVKDL
jgi:transcription initiation factor IIE alpha subunit